MRFSGVIWMLWGEVVASTSRGWTSCVFLNVAARADPLVARAGQPLGHIAFEIRVVPRTGTIIDTDGFIYFHLAARIPGGGKADFAKRHSNGGMQFPTRINFPAIWKPLRAPRLNRVGFCDHKGLGTCAYLRLGWCCEWVLRWKRKKPFTAANGFFESLPSAA